MVIVELYVVMCVYLFCEYIFLIIKGEAHIGSKKYFNSSELGVLSTTANSNPGSVDTGTGCAVREQHKQDFDQNQDSVPSSS